MVLMMATPRELLKVPRSGQRKDRQKALDWGFQKVLMLEQ
jgi:hypothetical protein